MCCPNPFYRVVFIFILVKFYRLTVDKGCCSNCFTDILLTYLSFFELAVFALFSSELVPVLDANSAGVWKQLPAAIAFDGADEMETFFRKKKQDKWLETSWLNFCRNLWLAEISIGTVFSRHCTSAEQIIFYVLLLIQVFVYSFTMGTHSSNTFWTSSFLM